MEEVGEVKEKKGKENRFGRRYGFEIKLRCVKLYLEEGLPLSMLAKEVGASTDGIRRWVKAYQERGEEGLRNAFRSSGRRRKLPGPVREKLFLENWPFPSEVSGWVPTDCLENCRVRGSRLRIIN